ncbi:MAG: hypothetical protein IJW65_05585 [Clostridia bacterium]|nr:hypothetical protein [Clostridia bacterium]
MKKVIIISAIILAAILVVAALAMLLLRPEEITLEGEYSNVQIGTGRILIFDKDNNVTAKYMSAGTEVYSVKGTYEISDGSIEISFDGEDAQTAHIFVGKHTLEIGDGFIKMDGIRYTKSE